MAEVSDKYFETRTEKTEATAIKCILFTTGTDGIKKDDTLQTVILNLLKRIEKLENDN